MTGQLAELRVHHVVVRAPEIRFSRTPDYINATAFGEIIPRYLVVGYDNEIAINVGGQVLRFHWPWRRGEPEMEVHFNQTAIGTPATGGTLPAPTATIEFNHDMDAGRIAAEVARLNTVMEQWNEYARAYGETINATRARMGVRPRVPLINDDEVRNSQRRARKLLLSLLTEKQRNDFEKNRWFFVQGEHILYRISSTGYVTTDAPNHGSFCFGPADSAGHRLPGLDNAAALKLMIEADEKEFLISANWSGKIKGKEYSLVGLDISGTKAAARPPGHQYTSRIYGGGSYEDIYGHPYNPWHNYYQLGTVDWGYAVTGALTLGNTTVTTTNTTVTYDET